MTIVLGILIFGLLVFVHELGHFLTARAFDVRVHAFSIGMGPAIWKKQRGEVEYALRALPIGGYVKLEGEDTQSDDPRAFTNRPPLARIAILIAGGLTNILAGFLIFTILFAFAGRIAVPLVGDVAENSPAVVAGMQVGDEIISINGKRVHIQNDVTLSMMQNGGDTATVVVRRAGEKVTLQIQPHYSEEQGAYILGFYPAGRDMTFGLAVKTAFYNTFFVVRLVFYSLGELISGAVRLQDMAGPVGIVSEMGKVAKAPDPILNMLNFMGLIAVNLGVMNLLPLPALDGGRIFFALVELVRRKAIKPEHEGVVHLIGMGLLLLFMVLVTWSDIRKLFA